MSDRRNESVSHWTELIEQALGRDRAALRDQLAAIERRQRSGQPFDRGLGQFTARLKESVALRAARAASVPALNFPEELPISARRDEIAQAIAAHPVVIVCGETGSGKSTQLPKICLGLGRGIDRLIGHTQPRRIAARSVAARIAEELRAPLGGLAGFQVRFADATSARTCVKVMTDGILLAELQSDPRLDAYDTIIIDEAHERSLNIDFLLGCLKGILARRSDLKLIVTSATIDAARFAAHFPGPDGPAPIVEVSGRAYPVEVRWRPLVDDEESGEPDEERALLNAVDELASDEPGDILIFMPTERDIHEAAKLLRKRPLPGDDPTRGPEILPLYARLSTAEQQRVFQPHARRRVVIATNVAESSLTVPGIRGVIDTGTARISRYAPRSKTQRLPIEAVSQASADQRKGRCGREGPGICIRLYGEDDYLQRERYTPPEIQRTNLAAVILQTLAFRLGDIETFPFLDPPRNESIRDGYKTLFELGAIDEDRRLTEIGRRLSRLPVDPRIGRIILAAVEENCLHEALIIAAALELQDPRERPLEKQQAADERHAQFAAPDSDFMGYLRLWDFYHGLREKLSRNQLRKACQQNFLSYNRLREWSDVHLELLRLTEQAGLRQRPRRDEYDPIHRAVLAGLLSSIACRSERRDYTTAGGATFQIWPGSAAVVAQPQWLVAAEMLETSRRYLRCCARIDPRWIEPLAGHLVNRSYSDLEWDARHGSAVAFERVSLFGLTIVPRRRVNYGSVDPDAAREMLIRHGLIEGQLQPPPEFHIRNERLRSELEDLQKKLRRADLLVDDWARERFYQKRVPREAYDAVRLRKWLRGASPAERAWLEMTKADLLREGTPELGPEAFPDRLAIAGVEMPLAYHFEPGSDDDGVTISVPVEALGQLDPQRLGWLVPGLLEQKVVALIRALPKELRRPFAPVPDTAQSVVAALRFGEGDLLAAVAAVLSRLGGVGVSPQSFQADKLGDELRMNIRVLDVDGQALASGRDLGALRRELGGALAETISAIEDQQWSREGLTDWDFDDLPKEATVRRGKLAVTAYPALVDAGQTASLRLMESAARAEQATRGGLRRLFFLAARRELKTQAQWLPEVEKVRLHAASLAGFKFDEVMPLLLADRAFLADRPLPRSRVEFVARLAEGRERIGVAVQETAKLLPALFTAYHQARLAIEQMKNPRWRFAADDAGAQLAELLRPGFLAATPWIWLQHYPRYLRAIAARLERVGPRDEEQCRDVQARWQSYLARAAEHEKLGLVDPELAIYRWMLEEYRVSLFAQKLGTSLTVSAARLDRQWQKCGS